MLPALGCEHAINLRGKVDVPAEVQRRFSVDAPGLVVMGGGFGSNTLDAQLLAVLCAPQDQPISIPIAHRQFGCAAEGTAWFRVLPHSARAADGGNLACGNHQQRFDALVNQGRVAPVDAQPPVATATVTIFAGKRPGSCRSGDDTINATVAPVR